MDGAVSVEEDDALRWGTGMMVPSMERGMSILRDSSLAGLIEASLDSDKGDGRFRGRRRGPAESTGVRRVAGVVPNGCRPGVARRATFVEWKQLLDILSTRALKLVRDRCYRASSAKFETQERWDDEGVTVGSFDVLIEGPMVACGVAINAGLRRRRKREKCGNVGPPSGFRGVEGGAFAKLCPAIELDSPGVRASSIFR